MAKLEWSDRSLRGRGRPVAGLFHQVHVKPDSSLFAWATAEEDEGTELFKPPPQSISYPCWRREGCNMKGQNQSYVTRYSYHIDMHVVWTWSERQLHARCLTAMERSIGFQRATLTWDCRVHCDR